MFNHSLYLTKLKTKWIINGTDNPTFYLKWCLGFVLPFLIIVFFIRTVRKEKINGGFVLNRYIFNNLFNIAFKTIYRLVIQSIRKWIILILQYYISLLSRLYNNVY